MASLGEKVPEQCEPPGGRVRSLRVGVLAAAVVLAGALGTAAAALGPLASGLALSALAGLAAALAHRFHDGRPQAEAEAGQAAFLAERERFMRAVADSAHGVEALFDQDGKLLWVNPSIERLTGYTPAECMAAPDVVELLAHPSDRQHARAQGRAALAGGSGREEELRLQHRSGSAVAVLCHWRPFLDAEGRQQGVRLSVEDIQARKETEYKFLETVAELRRAQALSEHYLARSGDERQRMAALLNLIRLGILFMDRDNRVQYYNRALLRIWGYPEDENLLGTRDVVLQSRVSRIIEPPEAYLKHIAEVVADTRASEPHEFRLADGRIITDMSTVVVGTEGGRAIGRVWIYEDVTEARRTARQLVELAVRDPLTNLYNRRRFHEELERELAEATRRGEEVGLVLLDLDGFKPINDRYGHQAGDEVLITLARELGRVVRRNEMFFRLGGDEFAILASNVDEGTLEDLARRVVERTAALRFSFCGMPAGITASLGLALYPRHAADGERLVAAADAAMYHAKAAGRNGWALAGRSHPGPGVAAGA